jgi:pilus assembly protein CpaC
LARDFPNDEINVTVDNETAFVRGTVKDLVSADRVMAMTASLGKTVNLLRVDVPPVETQILLKVRFCSVDRVASMNLGLSLASGAGNQSTQISPGVTGVGVGTNGSVTLSDALNIFLFRKDLNIGAAIQALQSKNMLQSLAEPNVLALNGKEASFLSGGEFPIPMVQGGSGNGAVSISFREFGIRLTFLPKITPRGTIDLQVAPEVSALDFAHALTFAGYTIPALTSRKIKTEVELDSGQSFVIAGLMDNTLTDTISKIPGLASIPLLGQLFTTKQKSRDNSELLVIVTPEVVRPIPAGQPVPALKQPQEYLPRNSDVEMYQPGIDKTGLVPVKPPTSTIPIEQLIEANRKQGEAAPNATLGSQPMTSVPGPAAPAPAAPAAPSGGTGK